MIYNNLDDCDKTYKLIYADPPWQYGDKLKVKGANGFIRGAESHYQTMKLEDVKNLPVSKISDKDAVLFMWITMPFIPKAEEVMNAWGFKYKTCGFTWVKTTKKGKIFTGMGHYTRGNAELCLLGIRGGGIEILDRGVSQIVMSQVQRHSKKPDCVRQKILQLYGDVPRIELFARDTSEGWDAFGNECNEYEQMSLGF